MPKLPFLTGLPVAAKWRRLGEQLGIPGHELDTIEATAVGRYRLNDCLSSMFESWLRRTTNECTYENLARALARVGEEKIAADLYRQAGEYYYSCSEMTILYLRWFGYHTLCQPTTVIIQYTRLLAS